MRGILCVILFFVASLSYVLAQQPGEVKAIELLAELYNDCDKRIKRCFGDNDICLQYKNCTFAISIAENRTTFKIITVNSCYEQGKEPSRDFYVGVGMNTVDSEGNRECREPTFDDFKAFIFWNNNQKCARKTYAFEVNVAYRNKVYWQTNCLYNKTLHGAEPRQGTFQLADYLQRYTIGGSESGDRPPFKFADKVDYIVKDRILYINRVQPPFEPKEVIFEMRKPSNASSHSESQSQQVESSSSALGRSIFIMLSMLLLSLWSILHV